MKAWKPFSALAAVVTLGDCSRTDPMVAPDNPDIATARSAIQVKMVDPNSANLQNERIRILWSDAGDRLKVYCANVNGANMFGGKTGYSPWYVVLDGKNVSYPNYPNLVLKGFVSGPAATNPDQYLMCDRTDTQRPVNSFFAATPGSTAEAGETPAELDRMVPVILQRIVPF